MRVPACGYGRVMSIPDQNRSSPPDDPSAGSERPPDDMRTDDTSPQSKVDVPRTRTGMAWVSVCVAALIGIALIVFLAQNTRRVQVSFLWMSTETPLAIALLIAAVGSIMLTLILGTARIPPSFVASSIRIPSEGQAAYPLRGSAQTRKRRGQTCHVLGGSASDAAAVHAVHSIGEALHLAALDPSELATGDARQGPQARPG